MSSTERNGFVLLEAVVALVIVSLFAIGLLAATSAQVRTSDKGAVLLQARALAEERLMAIRILDYDALNQLPDSLEQGVFPEPFQDFTWTARVAPVKDEYDLFEVEVIVERGDEAFPLNTLLHEPRPVATMPAGGR